MFTGLHLHSSWSILHHFPASYKILLLIHVIFYSLLGVFFDSLFIFRFPTWFAWGFVPLRVFWWILHLGFYFRISFFSLASSLSLCIFTLFYYYYFRILFWFYYFIRFLFLFPFHFWRPEVCLREFQNGVWWVQLNNDPGPSTCLHGPSRDSRFSLKR